MIRTTPPKPPKPVPEGSPAIDSDSEIHPEMEDLITEGRELTKERKFPEALRLLIKAVNMCPCHPAGNPPPRHKKDKSCHISHFIQALDKPDPEILFDTAKAPCPCGYVWPSCARQQHALALDALAQCLEQADQLVSAFSTALSIINLDPTSAIGYCRVATMIHALLKNMADEMPPPARSLATAIAGSGPPTMKLRGILRSFLDRSLNITTQRRRGPKGKYDIILQKMAYLKKVNIHKRDPVRMLPPELLHMVFAVLPMSDRLRCLRVNKQWNHAIMNDSMLWTEVTLARPGNPKGSLGAFFQRHQREIRALAIDDISHFGVTLNRLCKVLHALPSLQRLRLNWKNCRPNQIDTSDILPRPPALRPSLTHLSFTGFGADGENVFQHLLELSSETLEALEVVDCKFVLSDMVGGVLRGVSLPRLKKLHLAPRETQTGTFPTRQYFTIGPVVEATPVLEEFSLDSVTLVPWVPPENKHLWPSLKSFALGPWVLAGLRPEGGTVTHFPLRASKLRSLQLFTYSDIVVDSVLREAVWDRLPAPPDGENTSQDALHAQHPLADLEVFRVAVAFTPRDLRDILGASAALGNLKVVELLGTHASLHGRRRRPPRFLGDVEVNGNDHLLDPATELDFLGDSITTIALRAFNFYHDPFDRSGTTSKFNGQPFVDWIHRFPNLHTVAVHPGQYNGVDLFIFQLIAHPRVKVLYQGFLTGVKWDEAKKLAAKNGVELVHARVLPRPRPEWDKAP